jgi:diketogulonate reductase-like aldo/keto reductase
MASASKVNKTIGGYQSCLNAIDDSLKKFGFGMRSFNGRRPMKTQTSFLFRQIDYLDLFLIHSAYGGKTVRLEAWKALLDARKAGKLRSVGVSN